MSALPALKTHPIEHVTKQEYWDKYYDNSEINILQ